MWIHKQTNQEMEKVITRCDVVERGKHMEMDHNLGMA